jgi:hypothetical protein
MTLSGQSRSEYMRKYRITQKQKRRVNREHTIEALRAAESNLIATLVDAPSRNYHTLQTALTGVRRALQVLEDGIKL